MKRSHAWYGLVVLISILTALASPVGAQQTYISWTRDCLGTISTEPITGGTRVSCEEILVPTETPTPTPTVVIQSDRFIDHQDLTDFPVPFNGPNRLGGDLRVYMRHRGVGQQIFAWGVRCFAGFTPTQPQCIGYTPSAGYNGGYTATTITNNITSTLFVAGNTAEQLIEWEPLVVANISGYDVFGMKPPYLDGIQSSPIFWANFDLTKQVYLRLAGQYPAKQFILTTQPLGGQTYYPGIGAYNQQVRAWWQTELADNSVPDNIWFYDVAALESSRLDGSRCLDGEGREIICPEYQTSPPPNAGHLTKDGAITPTIGFWVLLSRIEHATMR